MSNRRRRTRETRPFLCLLAALACIATAAAGGVAPPAAALRIVSLVPAVTEMLFAIGAGPSVVGVSSFDHYPPEVASRTRVGALLDPDVERIIALRPDLVVVHDTQDDLKRQLASAGIPTFEHRHGNLADIMATIRSVGRRTGFAAEADRIASGLERRIELVRRRTAGLQPPRTMLVFGRQPLALRNIHASGGVGFLHDMLVAAGGVNVFADVPRQSIQATSETILARAPEAIVELRYGKTANRDEIARERASWDALPSVPAVRAGRVVILVGDEFVIPGPRIADATERLGRALHPDAFAKGVQ